MGLGRKLAVGVTGVSMLAAGGGAVWYSQKTEAFSEGLNIPPDLYIDKGQDAAWLCDVNMPDCSEEQAIAVSGRSVYQKRVPYDAIGSNLVDAVVAIEDRRFWDNSSIDVKALGRAAVANLTEGWGSQGGSSITVQLASFFIEDKFGPMSGGKLDAIDRKSKELFLAKDLHDSFTPQARLEAYLNLAYFGRGAYGAEAASELYFGVPANQLKDRQANFLAGALKAPSCVDDRSDPNALHQNDICTRIFGVDPASSISEKELGDMRSLQVADALIETNGYREGNTAERVIAAYKDPMEVAPMPVLGGEFGRVSPGFEHWASWVLGNVDTPGATGPVGINTTLDSRIQTAVMSAIGEVTGGMPNATTAAVVLGPKGEVQAMVGGQDFNTQQSNFAVEGRGGSGRSPGSSFKPFAMAAALGQGMKPGDRIPAPEEFLYEMPKSGGQVWEVHHGHADADGTISLENLVVRSSNTASAFLILQTDMQKDTLNILEAAGIEIENPQPSFILGGGVAAFPMDLARAYQAFAHEGKVYEPYPATSFVTSIGKRTLYEQPEPTEVLDKKTAETVGKALFGVINSPEGTGTAAARPDMFLAGKTGTVASDGSAGVEGNAIDPSSVSNDGWITVYDACGRVYSYWTGNINNEPVPGLSSATDAEIAGRVMDKLKEQGLTCDAPAPNSSPSTSHPALASQPATTALQAPATTTR